MPECRFVSLVCRAHQRQRFRRPLCASDCSPADHSRAVAVCFAFAFAAPIAGWLRKIVSQSFRPSASKASSAECSKAESSAYGRRAKTRSAHFFERQQSNSALETAGVTSYSAAQFPSTGPRPAPRAQKPESAKSRHPDRYSAHMSRRSHVMQLTAKSMTAIRLQRHTRQQLPPIRRAQPRNFRARSFRLASLDRTAIRKIPLKMRRVHFHALNRPAIPNFTIAQSCLARVCAAFPSRRS